MTDKDSRNTTSDDEDFVHRNWMTDQRIAGMICLLPGVGLVVPLFFAYGSSPLEELLPSPRFVISDIVGPRADLPIVLLALGGTLAMIWGMWKLLQITAR